MARELLLMLLLSILLAPVLPNPCSDLDYQYRPSKELPNGRRNFPDDFVFATATSAYQIEGAANKFGRGPSVWDRFSHQFPERIADRSNGDVALDHYKLWKEDIEIMKSMNMDAYRFSISWSRIIPYGKISTGVNEAGIKFYHDLLDLLLKNGLQPFVTIWHWDTPQALEAEYGGFLSRDIVKDFEDYCDLLFKEYGGKVKKWITLNEPETYTLRGYDEGFHAPGRCSAWVNRACLAGDSSTEPYIVAHHLLLAHAAAYKLYNETYRAKQKGEVGITLVTFWFVPYSNATADVDAAQRALDFMFGWYMDPVTFGHYPRYMVDLVGSRLPIFSEYESSMLKNSHDFVGLNYYTAYYAKNNTHFDPVHLRYNLDSHAFTTAYGSDGQLIGKQLGSYWQYLYSDGLRQLLEYTKEKYNDPFIYITENGMSVKDRPGESLAEARNDTERIYFYNDHLTSVRRAMDEKQVKVKGFFAWSYADNYEWEAGYSVRFGLYYINYTDLSRNAKHSACWYASFCNKKHALHTTTKTAAAPVQASSAAAAAGGRRALHRPTS